MKKNLPIIILTVILCLACFVGCDSKEETSVNRGSLEDSSGLEFTSNGNGTCYVSGIGNCTDSNLIIPSKSPSGDKVTAIGERAFEDCDSIRSLKISDSVTLIGEAAFSGCENLKSVNIGNGVKTIEVDAFCYCPNLKKVTIGKNVVEIADYAFFVCQSLDEFSVNSENTIYKSVGGVLYSDDGKTLIKYPEGKTDKSFRVPASVTKIAAEAFLDANYLEEVTVTGNVHSIGANAFYCSNVNTVTIGIGVKSIGESAFADSCLTVLNYLGSQDDWENIDIGDDNDILMSVSINYNYNAE